MPPNPFDAIAGPIKALHHDAGWAGTVYNFTLADTSADPPAWFEESPDTEFDIDAGTPITMRIEGPEAGASTPTESGRTIQGEVRIVVDPDEATFTAGVGEDARASEIVDETDGQRYRVEAITDEHTGVLVLDCDRQT